RKKDFGQANALLDRVEALLQQVPPPDPAAEWKQKLAQWTPALKAALAAKGPDAAAIAKLLPQATALSKPGAYLARALEKLAECHALATAGATATAPQGAPTALSLIKLGKARLEWIGSRSKAVQDIGGLKAAIEAELKDDPEQQGQLAAALKRLDGLITELNEDLGNQLDAVLNASDPGQSQALARTAQATMDRFIKFVDTDEIMAELDGNEVLPGLQITGPLRAKLRDIAIGLGVG